MVVIVSYYQTALSRVKISHCKKNLFNRSAARVTLHYLLRFRRLRRNKCKIKQLYSK